MFELKPFKKTEDLFERMLKSFNEVFDQGEIPTLDGNFNSFRTDVKETEEAYLVEAELPGFEKEDITIDVEDNYLLIHAKRDEEKETRDNDDRIIRQERRYGEFMRRFYVDNIDEEKIKAKLKNGVLKIELPKLEPTKPPRKRIEVE